MESTGTNNIPENAESKIQTAENEIKPQQRSAEKEKLVLELTDMGFSKSLVLQIVDNAGDVPKNLIVEQLLTTSSEPSVNIPVVDDDGDKLWEDVTVANKMVIVINSGLNMSIGKTASQAAHAALGLYEVMKERADLSYDLITWNEQGSRKIVVAAKNTNELIKVCSEGKIQKIPFFCVHDAGLTEVEPNSFTALAFFGSDQELKPVTGKLRLLK
ncbi:probable peptidyl-tRNA hydrolase 2 isoform X1 [Metopolophium dirhodum]|uniref:probable peptidyl-tRNA hydrolase 2 isoform X1 n=2 Tax=Metopolophium dirhodum TaxID=44670 RepID=UPI00298FEC55|nr:probable peptidyl-tRNA hydrolase 2 isoform X1 [Metopolophium dirhodum]